MNTSGWAAGVGCSEWTPTFQASWDEAGNGSRPAKIAVLATSEYEGIYKNGGVGTYYKTLSEQLAAQGWHVVLLLCGGSQTFGGGSTLPAVRRIYSTREAEQVLVLQPVHEALLAAFKPDVVREESFRCLLFVQAIAHCFADTPIFVEFPEMMALGFDTIQAKRARLLPKTCTVAVTLHGGHEWVCEANERFDDQNLDYFWQVSACQQYTFENADLPYFPSYYLRDRVASYGWRTERGIHLPYCAPIVHLSGPPVSAGEPVGIGRRPLVFFGRLEERKGLCTFVEALKMLDEPIRRQLHVLFVGKSVFLNSPELVNRTSDEYIQDQLAGVVSFSIHSDFFSNQAIRFIHALEHPLVVLASHQENFPNTALEMGQLPVQLIVSDTGGFRETLGLLGRSQGVHWFSPKDSRSLARAAKLALAETAPVQDIPDAVRLQELNKSLTQQKLQHIAQVGARPAALNQDRDATVSALVLCREGSSALSTCLRSLDIQTRKLQAVAVLLACPVDKDFQAQLDTLPRDRYTFLHSPVMTATGIQCRDWFARTGSTHLLVLAASDQLLPGALEVLLSAAVSAQAVFSPALAQARAERAVNVIPVSLNGLLRAVELAYPCGLYERRLVESLAPLVAEGPAAGLEWLAGAVAGGAQIAHYPYPLYTCGRAPAAQPGAVLAVREQFFLRTCLARLPVQTWSPREFFLLLTAWQQLVTSQKSAAEQLQSNYRELERAWKYVHSLQEFYADLKQQSQVEREGLQTEIAAMESSKFWKLRGQWLRLKKLLRPTWQTPPRR
ncbi:glycosyltransferase family 4 protein [Gloeobacter violaceus]|uniref:Gll4301 protein n=1 Tax=Gloeobacter violaceus (strain ATCC 29082 / PCC 7421) TaxID=251221 RepID=Q7NDD4_GLOVI|nr:glycosyltransferase family 4 protein [Gloeobacter violaceus]BAC92242.1 gll4301 [Gloeobacter violaceus PCC 7421]